MATDPHLVLSGKAAALDELQASDHTPPVSLATSAWLGPVFRMSLICPAFHALSGTLTRLNRAWLAAT